MKFEEFHNIEEDKKAHKKTHKKDKGTEHN